MPELYKLIAHDAFELCCERESNAAWTWEKVYADLLIKECITIIQNGITRDGHNTEKYKRSMQHIEDIKTIFEIKE